MNNLPLPLRFLAAAALGLLTPLAFAPCNWHWLPPPLLAVLFALVAGGGWRRAAAIGWVYGAAAFGFGLNGVYIAAHTYGQAPPWLAAAITILLCAYLALYPALVLALAERMGLFRRLLGWVGVPALWLFAELLRRTLLGGGLPWLALGYSQLDTPLARLAPVVGVYGISAVLVWIAYALHFIASSRGLHRAAELVALFAPALVLFLPRPGTWTEPDGRPVPTAIVQAGGAEDRMSEPGAGERLAARYRQLTLDNIGSSLVVWPEGALPQTLEQIETTLLRDFRQVLRAHGTTLLFGTLDVEPMPFGTPLIHNSAAAVGITEGRYDKRHRLPFGEFFPMPAFMRPPPGFLGMPDLEITAGAARQPLLHIGEDPVAVMIALEDAYGAEFRDDARRAAYLIDLSKDSWYGRSAAAQHLQIARLRAIEYGREIVRATDTGLSAFIGADGALLKQSELFTETVLRQDVQPRRGATPYMRWGDAPLWWISGWISLGLTGFALRRPPSRRKT
jgi:apolipoprotein N-acyltransferase